MTTGIKIQNGWKQIMLKEIGDFSKGFGISKAELVDAGINAIRYGELYTRHHFKVKKIHSFISESSIKTSKKIKHGDIIFAGSGETIDEIGKSAAYLSNSACYVGGDTIILRPKNANSLFLAYTLNIGDSRKELRKLGQGQSVVHLYKSDLENLLISLPPLPEQEKIVEVLETWDEYLEKLIKIIKNKKVIKKSLRQGLLTGKSFLSKNKLENNKYRYFTTPKHWKVVPISEVAVEISKKNSRGDKLPVLSCTKHFGLVDSLKFFKKQIFSKKLHTYKIVARNNFVYATNHIEEGSIGLQTLYDIGVVSPMYTVFKTDKEKIRNDYLYPLLKTELFRHIFEARTSSSVNRRGSLRWKSFSKIKIPLPPLSEQTAIAQILTTADQEIETLEKKKELIEKQKKFLLNNLVTGRIRLPEFTDHIVNANKMVKALK